MLTDQAFAELKTGCGVAYIRKDEVLAVVPTGLNQTSLIFRGGGAVGMNFPTAEVAQTLGITDAPAPTVLKLAE